MHVSVSLGSLHVKPKLGMRIDKEFHPDITVGPNYFLILFSWRNSTLKSLSKDCAADQFRAGLVMRSAARPSLVMRSESDGESVNQ